MTETENWLAVDWTLRPFFSIRNLIVIKKTAIFQLIFFFVLPICFSKSFYVFSDFTYNIS